MNKNEWIAYHDKLALKHGETDTYSEKNCFELFSEENGLFEFAVCDQEFVLLEVIGNLSYWDKVIPEFAKKLGCTKMVAYYKTDKPKRLERLYKSKVTSQIDGVCKFERMI